MQDRKEREKSLSPDAEMWRRDSEQACERAIIENNRGGEVDIKAWVCLSRHAMGYFSNNQKQ